MTLSQKLFGLNLMAPAGDGEGGGGGAVDRGDDFQSTEADVATTPETTDKDDLKLATGEEDPPARDETGKFTKKEKDPEGATIPKSRFDSAVQKERERAEIAERRLAELTAQSGRIQRNADLGKLEEDVKELRAQERKALIQGDDKLAAEMSEQADRLNRQIAIAQAGDMTAAAKDAALEGMRMELAFDNIEATYPALDANSEEYDQDLTDDVLDKQRGYMERERLSPSKALLKAVKYVMSKVAVGAAAPPPAGLRGATAGQDRKTAAVAKNLSAAGRQPASTKPLGADSDKHGQTAPTPDASQMTFADFSALPEATKAKMRGDFIE